jgi:tetratricopeptide (TPR) repeat protein
MSDGLSQSESTSEVDTALLDAELFVKYRAPERAIQRLRLALERTPRSIPMRERLREIAASHKHQEEAARQCLTLASLYIERENFDNAHDRLLEAKHLDPRINIAAGLDAIRRARLPHARPGTSEALTEFQAPRATLTGNLSDISVFDAIQVLENAKLTGTLLLESDVRTAQLLFNEGQIVDATCAGQEAENAFCQILDITSGNFEFQKSTQGFNVVIQAASNTNLILDTLRRLDEQRQ